MFLRCTNCKFQSSDLSLKRCPNCNGFLILELDKIPSEWVVEDKEVGIWRYKRFLPKISSRISLGEGKTPILKAIKLSKELGLEVYLKNEGLNPTGTFMDRGSAIYISFLKDIGVKEVKCFTTGNFGCSIAAYSSKAGLECEIFVHEKANHFKLLQMVWFGAKIKMGYDKLIMNEKNLITQADPLFIEGLKTQMYEVVEYFKEEIPDYIILPIGSGANIYSFFKAYKELSKIGQIKKKPLFVGAKPNSEAAKTFIDLDPSFLYCESLIKEIKREDMFIEEVASKEEMINSMSIFAREEGILVEPISSIALSVLYKLRKKQLIKDNSRVLIVLTGSGLKEIGSIVLLNKRPIKKIKVGHELGFTKLKILELLKEKSMSGYELWKKLKEFNINIKLSTLYEHLKELEELNLISSNIQIIKNRKTNIRSLTSFGEKYLETFKRIEQ
jgi:threonine synthase